MNFSMFEPYLAAILTTFVQHLKHLPTGVIRKAIELQSYSTQGAFWTLCQHSQYFYWVPTTFELNSRANALGICKNHLKWVHSEFLAFEVILEKTLFICHSHLNAT